ncbi:hypothetical protein PCC6912_36160 [Chlorogloeopsis fritschii PCC 6912]|uniref:Uncharacterized protein n=1 Tax=Chlorogloeopsis fritschii PCC 6912 TaxID=211165 RepID=A0A3S0ZV29_CHLFR|nr:hypothetical protein PCC6912_36160 [Chlorogloeopsis fritschii PCC 6912]
MLDKDRTTGPKRKAISPCTLNPGTKAATSQKQMPLTMSENAPNDKKLSGKDKVDKTGFTDPLTAPITTAAIKAAGKLAILTPGTTKSTINKLKAVIKAANKFPVIVFT